MARSVILGNGGLTVGLNENGLVHDFYYPYVGLENLTTARSEPHRIGVWVDDTFSWVDDANWIRRVDFNDDALVSNITLENTTLELMLHFTDFVDAKYDIFARNIRVHNKSDRHRNIRIFFHQVFEISADGRADTVMYVPDEHYVLDYKGKCSILAYAETESGVAFDQYAVGNAGIEGKEGTFRDAEDGNLSMSAVEHSSVDSTIRVSLDIGSGNIEDVHYWLAVGNTQSDILKLHDLMLGEGFHSRRIATMHHWHDWLAISEDKLQNIDAVYKTAIKKSLLVIKAHTDNDGGVIASCDSSIYNYGRDYYSYVWPRDGAFVMWPLIKLGYTHEPKNFFMFCKKVMHRDGYMLHKYQPDQAIGSTWHPLIHGKSRELAIQEDETASIIIMLGEYLHYSNDENFVGKLYESMVKPMAQFMNGFIDKETNLPHASYDLWEEKFLTTTYTTALTYRALLVAAQMALLFGDPSDAETWTETAELFNNHSAQFFNEQEGHYTKGFILQGDKTIHDNTLDISSFYGVYKFQFGDAKQAGATLHRIEDDLLEISPSGGTARYENDAYFRSEPAFMGNPWFVTTLWLSQFYALSGNKDKGKYYVDWALRNMTASGLLSEQINPTTSSVVGVTPLVWSHAELINAILDVEK